MPKKAPAKKPRASSSRTAKPARVTAASSTTSSDQLAVDRIEAVSRLVVGCMARVLSGAFAGQSGPVERIVGGYADVRLADGVHQFDGYKLQRA